MEQFNPADRSPGRGAERDLRSAADVLAILWRYAAAIAAVTLLVAAVARTAAGQRHGAVEARARLGLTEQVVWPFYDAARDRQVTALRSPAVVDAVSEAVSATGTTSPVPELRIEVPLNQSFVDVVAEAEDPRAARAAVNAAADALVIIDEERLAADIRLTIAANETSAEALSDDLAAFEAELASSIAEEARLSEAARTAIAGAIAELERQRLAAQAARASIELRRNAVLEQLNALEGSLVTERIELETVQPQIEVLRYQAESSLAGDTGSWRDALLPTLMTLAAAAVAALLWDAHRGRVRSAQQLTVDPALQPVTELRLEQTDVESVRPAGDPSAALVLFDAAVAHRFRTIAVVDADRRHPLSTPVLDALALQLREGGYVVGSVLPTPFGRGEGQRSLESVRRQAASKKVGAQRAPAAVVWPMTAGLGDLAGARAALDVLAAQHDLVLVDGGSGDLTPAAVLARARSCDAVVVVVRAGATRVHHVRAAARLHRSHGPVLGTIVVRIDRPRPAAPEPLLRFGAEGSSGSPAARRRLTLKR